MKEKGGFEGTEGLERGPREGAGRIARGMSRRGRKEGYESLHTDW